MNFNEYAKQFFLEAEKYTYTAKLYTRNGTMLNFIKEVPLEEYLKNKIKYISEDIQAHYYRHKDNKESEVWILDYGLLDSYILKDSVYKWVMEC